MIQIEHLNKTYDRRRIQEKQVLYDISLTLPDTGFVCILGPSGCGKTSLLNAIGALDEFDSGTITTGGATFHRWGDAGMEAHRSRSFGYIFQNYYLLPEHSVGYNVYLGLHALKLSHAEKLRRVREALQAVEMERYIRRNVAALSGGQQQRVAIARALARKPRVIFADEPTGNLDEANTRNICALLRRISKTSLVVMVTHEERIARFFADRIIRLENGRVTDDTSHWQRGSLEEELRTTLYAGDFPETRLEADRISLRLFQEEGCAPVNICVFALKDRIVLKVDDGRAVTCSGSQEPPVFAEGSRPVLTLEELDREEPDSRWAPAADLPAEAGRGIGWWEMLREALHMSRTGGLRIIGTRVFLVVLTVLTALSAADTLALSEVDPRDFIQTHSQVLEVTLERGEAASATTLGLQDLANELKSYLPASGLSYSYIPAITHKATVSGSPIVQTSKLSVTLQNFSYTPLALLDETTLILGRLPENTEEVVVDKWVLEKTLARDGVAQNGISGIDYFLGKQITYQNLTFAPTIVGICDSNEPAVYMMEDLFASMGASGTAVASLSALQAKYPGKYDAITLGADECLVLPENAGGSYRDKLGANFTTNSRLRYRIAGTVEETDFYPKLIVADEQIQQIMLAMSYQKFNIFCSDKGAMKAYLESIPEQMGNTVSVTVRDNHSTKMNEYQTASRLRLDERTIITATVILLSMVMLYLLRRAQVYERIGMLSVYRLLGIPGRKAAGIFAIESLLGTLTTALPTAVIVWAVLALLPYFPIRQIGLTLPWYWALAVYLGIVGFHLAVTLAPLLRLLRQPPAQLAAKFDF